jgi:hypothetical protein
MISDTDFIDRLFAETAEAATRNIEPRPYKWIEPHLVPAAPGCMAGT